MKYPDDFLVVKQYKERNKRMAMDLIHYIHSNIVFYTLSNFMLKTLPLDFLLLGDRPIWEESF